MCADMLGGDWPGQKGRHWPRCPEVKESGQLIPEAEECEVRICGEGGGKMIWVFRWNTESGDEGFGPYWIHSPSPTEIQAVIDGNGMLKDEEESETLYYRVVEVKEAPSL